VAIPRHLQDGEEFNTPFEPTDPVRGNSFSPRSSRSRKGAGRPLSKGTGAAVSDPTSPLLFPRNFDRISSPDRERVFWLSQCACRQGQGRPRHGVSVLAQRFDHDLDHSDNHYDSRWLWMNPEKIPRNSRGEVGSETAAPVPFDKGRPAPSWIVNFARKAVPRTGSVGSKEC